MHIEFHVEEPSAEAALTNLLPKIIGFSHTIAIRVYSGKHSLLARLPARLQGYPKPLPSDWRIVVLVDEDREDCVVLKTRLDEYAKKAKLVTRIAAQGGPFHVLNRVVVEELEAWFLGDIDALVAAYPRLPQNLGKRARYRNPDAIDGGTWETLERVLQKAGYYRGGMPKIETARLVSRHMEPERNRSKSFQVFRDGLQELAGR